MLNETNLHAYQKASVEHIINNPACALFLDMGLGKTVSTLTAVNRLLYEDFDISNALVIAPKRVAETVWSTECEKWGHLNHLKLSKIIGTEKQRKAAIAVKADIYIISRDNIAWLVGQFGGSMLPYDMLVIDESSSFKSPKAQRFKALRMVRASFSRVVELTGTPAPNGLIDLWSQIYLLDKGERLEKTVTRYRQKYFNEGRRNGNVVYEYRLRSDSEELIHKQLEDICISMKASDYLNVPERIDNVIELELPASVRKEYKEFEKNQILEILRGNEANEITVANAAALSNKLLQFANGAVYDENHETVEVHDVKIDALEEILENANGQPVFVAWTYRSDVARIMKKLAKYNPRELKTEKDILDWNKGNVQLMLAHPASAGHGLNLQAGGHIIVWFGITWSLELYQQFNGRLHRQGQTQPTVVNHLVVKGSIDEDVMRSLAGKDAKQEGLMEAVKARIAEYLKK